MQVFKVRASDGQVLANLTCEPAQPEIKKQPITKDINQTLFSNVLTEQEAQRASSFDRMNLRAQLSVLRKSAEIASKRSRDPSRTDTARIHINDFREEEKTGEVKLNVRRGRGLQEHSQNRQLSNEVDEKRWLQGRRSGRRDRVKASLQSRSTSRVKCLKAELLSTLGLPVNIRISEEVSLNMDERKPSKQSIMPSEDLKENVVLSAIREPFSASQLHIVENSSVHKSGVDGAPEVELIDSEHNAGRLQDLNVRCAKLFQSTHINDNSPSPLNETN